MENPIKIDDLGVPLFLETPIYSCILTLCKRMYCDICQTSEQRSQVRESLAKKSDAWCDLSFGRTTSKHDVILKLAVLPISPASDPNVTTKKKWHMTWLKWLTRPVEIEWSVSPGLSDCLWRFLTKKIPLGSNVLDWKKNFEPDALASAPHLNPPFSPVQRW